DHPGVKEKGTDRFDGLGQLFRGRALDRGARAVPLQDGGQGGPVEVFLVHGGIMPDGCDARAPHGPAPPARPPPRAPRPRRRGRAPTRRPRTGRRRSGLRRGARPGPSSPAAPPCPPPPTTGKSANGAAPDRPEAVGPPARRSRCRAHSVNGAATSGAVTTPGV